MKLKKIGMSLKELIFEKNNNINIKRFNRQLQGINKWLESKDIEEELSPRGTLCYPTGYGKSFCAVLAHLTMQQAFDENKTTIVVAPRTAIVEQYKSYIDTYNLVNFHVYTINTVVNNVNDFYCDLLVLDELHRYGGLKEDINLANKFISIFSMQHRWRLGLTATLERLDNLHKILEDKCPVCDFISVEDAVDNKYITDSLEINYGVSLNETINTNNNLSLIKSYNELVKSDNKNEDTLKQIQEIENSKDYYDILCKRISDCMGIFYSSEFSPFSTALACSKGTNIVTTLYNSNFRKSASSLAWRKYVIQKFEETIESENANDGIQTKIEHKYTSKDIYNLAGKLIKYTSDRKKYINSHNLKILECVKLIKKYKNDNKIIIFCEDVDSCNKLNKILHKENIRCGVYHSKVPSLGFLYDPEKEGLKPNKNDISDLFNNKLPLIVKPKNDRTTFDKTQSAFIKKQGYKILSGKKIKELILKEYKENKFNILITAQALNEGYNENSINMAIFLARSRSFVTQKQRRGRTTRIDENNANKLAVSINLFIKDTVDENWLKSAQKISNNIFYANSISEIDSTINEIVYDSESNNGNILPEL